MESEDIFSRTSLILGKEGVEKLKKSFVILAGVGAVGGYILEALARVGVGHIKIIDFDSFSKSNLNRQLLAVKNTIDMPKVDIARQRVLSINPDCQIETLSLRIDRDNACKVLGSEVDTENKGKQPSDSENIQVRKPDILVDAIDCIEGKVALLSASVRSEIKTFSAMGAALRTDASKIKISSLADTKNCPLASLVRKGLRKNGIDLDKITCVFSEEVPKIKPKDSDNNGKRILGSLPTITGIMGLTLANAIIMELIGSDSTQTL